MHSARSNLKGSQCHSSIGDLEHDFQHRIASTLGCIQETINSHTSDKDNHACEQQQQQQHTSGTTAHIASVNDILEKRDNYYDVLSVDRHCTSIQIKKAYRKLALQYHPDKNKAPGADEAFKLISKAFTVLSDPEQRANYNACGHEYAKHTSPFFRSYKQGNDISPEDLYNAFFGQDGLDDPGFSSATFVGPGFTPHTYYSSHNNKGREQRPLHVQRWGILLQVMPLLILFAYSLLVTLIHDTTSLTAVSITITTTTTSSDKLHYGSIIMQ
ncbi:DnaJ-domain-containing protein [Lichtheimia hyalospora FSU 10163]|nr:DnaJ-domain-containing protein [Lichtheimia hyalospora FSU 10163]